MNINQNVALNLSADGIAPRLRMVQGDSNTRTIVATLWDGAQLYTIPTGSTVMLRFRKPDGTGGLYDTTEGGKSITFSGSTVTAPVATQMLAVAGSVFAELDIYGAGTEAQAEKLATFRFVAEVTPSVYPDAEIISSDYYNVLTAKIAEAMVSASAAAGSASEAAQSAANAAAAVEGAVKYNAAQSLTTAQQAQARENIGALGASDDVAKESTVQLILSAVNGLTPKRYGYRVKEGEANPSSRVEYLFDAVGMTPAAMNYAAGTFGYGSWADVWFVRDNVPYMVNSDGSVAYQLDPNDYTKKAVTGAASDVANTAFGGNAMSAIPLVWVKRYQENGYRYVIFCETQYDEGYKAYAHTRPDGTISPFAYGPMFEGSKVDTKLRSLSGQAPVSSLNATQELTAAQANGDNWTLTTWAFWNLIHDLLVLLGKSTNIQAVFGQGHTTGGASAADLLTTGALNAKGQFFGYSDTAHSVKVFHMENFWGDRWDRLVGLIYDNGTYKVKMTPEDGGYNLTGAGYEAVRKGINATETGGGWVKNAQQTEYGLFPTVLGGSDVTYDCDYHYYNPAIVSVPLVGGGCDDGSRCGRYLDVDAVAGAAGWNFGASLFLQNPS